MRGVEKCRKSICSVSVRKAIGRSFGGLRLVKLNKRQSERKGYADNFFCMGALYGNLYRIYSKENYEKRDFVCGAYDLIEGIECPQPCDYIRSLPRDRMDDAYMQEFPSAFFSAVRWKNGEMEGQFSALLAQLLEASAIGHIAFLVRELADPPEKIVGCTGLAKFLEMMRAQEIYENIVYLIRADDKENDDGKFGHV